MARRTALFLGTVGLSICAASAADAADGLDLSGTTRARYEYIRNQARPGFNRNDDIINFRTILQAKYQAGPFALIGELWDSRIYGDNAGTPVSTNEVNALEFVQAHLAFADTIGKAKISAQLGRFILNVGSRRLIAADDYRNTTNGYTGTKVDFTLPGDVQGTALYVLPQQRRPDDFASLRRNAVRKDHEGFDLVLWGATVAKHNAIGATTLEGTYYHLGEHDRVGRPTRDRSLDTFGLRLLHEPEPGQFSHDIEAFYQTGTISTSLAANAPTQSVSAWYLRASGGYAFEDAWHTRLSVEYDMASGDKAGGRFGRFDTLFGMRRAELAPSGLYAVVGRTNLSTPGVRLETTPSKRWDALATYHAMWLAERTDSFSTVGLRDATGRSGSFAGHQFDTRVRWWAVPQAVRLEFDSIVLMKGHFLEHVPNAPPGKTTVYGSFNVTTFF